MSYPLFINKLLLQKLVGGSDIFCAFHDHEWRSFRTYLLPPMCLLLLGCRWLSLSWLGKDDKHDAHLRWMLLTLPVVQLQWLLWQWVVTLLRLLTRQGRTFDCLRVPPPKIIPYRNIPLLGIPKSAIPEAQSYPKSPLVICWISPTLIFAGWFSMVPSDSCLKSHSVSVVTTDSVHDEFSYFNSISCGVGLPLTFRSYLFCILSNTLTIGWNYTFFAAFAIILIFTNLRLLSFFAFILSNLLGGNTWNVLYFRQWIVSLFFLQLVLTRWSLKGRQDRLKIVYSGWQATFQPVTLCTHSYNFVSR